MFLMLVWIDGLDEVDLRIGSITQIIIMPWLIAVMLFILQAFCCVWLFSQFHHFSSSTRGNNVMFFMHQPLLNDNFMQWAGKIWERRHHMLSAGTQISHLLAILPHEHQCIHWRGNYRGVICYKLPLMLRLSDVHLKNKLIYVLMNSYLGMMLLPHT